MIEIVKGDWVVASEGVLAPYARNTDRVMWIEEGEELLVRSVGKSTVNVSTAPRGAVVRVPLNHVTIPARKVGQVPPGGIGSDDPRIAWLFEDAERMAVRLGLCEDFDRICDALGIPGREREFTIKLANADGVKVTAKVVARSRALAEQRLVDQFRRAPLAIGASS